MTMADIITTNCRVIETRIDPKTGEQVTIDRDAFLLDDPDAIELDRQPAPPIVKSADEQLAELKAAIVGAKDLPTLKTEVAKLISADVAIEAARG